MITIIVSPSRNFAPENDYDPLARRFGDNLPELSSVLYIMI